MSIPIKDTRVAFACAVLEKFVYAREEGVPMIVAAEPGDGATLIVRRLAMVRAPLRAPHHTASRRALLGELALAAGGILYLDEADKHRRGDLVALIHHWNQMAMNPARPILVLRVDVSEGEAGLARVSDAIADGTGRNDVAFLDLTQGGRR